MALTIQYCSDLHLEFPLNAKLMEKHPIQIAGDILVLAGDIVPFSIMDKHKAFFDFVADNYKCVYWLPGNHEYYHSDIAQRSGIVNETIRSNLFLVNNIVIEHGPVQLIFSTLWSRIDLANEWEIERAMSDFHLIKSNGSRFSIPIFNQLHDESISFIRQAVKEPAKTKVVVTHHVPTFMHYPEKYKRSMLCQAFATELFDFIEPSNIHSWIYGHHHCNVPDFKIGNTELCTNQLGYVKHGEHIAFSRSKIISVI